MISGILVILIAWYFMYRIWFKPQYEEKYKKKLRFRDSLNPKYWDKFGTKYEVHITEEDYKQLKKKLK